MGWFVIVGTLPIGVLGAGLQGPDRELFRDLRLIGTTLIVFGLVLGVADRTGGRNGSAGEAPQPCRTPLGLRLRARRSP